MTTPLLDDKRIFTHTTMAAADVAPRLQGTERTTKRRPFAAWVKRLTSLKGGEQNGSNSKKEKSGNPLTDRKSVV